MLLVFVLSDFTIFSFGQIWLLSLLGVIRCIFEYYNEILTFFEYLKSKEK